MCVHTVIDFKTLLAATVCTRACKRVRAFVCCFVCVCVQVPSLKLELTGNVFRSQKACSAKEILEQLTRVQLSSDTSQVRNCFF